MLATIALEQNSGRLIAEDLRWVFISFLFAFALSTIAEKCGKLFVAPGLRRKKIRPLMDLVVATFLVTSSWIGWSVAIEAGCCGEMNRIFERPTLEFLLDIGLVVLYYALVQGIELPKNEPSFDQDPANVPFWIMLIFIGYLIWDLVVYVIISYPTIKFGQYGIITLICAGISTLTWLAVRQLRLDNQIVIDLWLLAVLLFFRWGKSVVLRSPASTLLSWMLLIGVFTGCVISICASRRRKSWA